VPGAIPARHAEIAAITTPRCTCKQAGLADLITDAAAPNLA